VTRTAYRWLAPELVEDYDETDFSFLHPDERAELRRVVGEFRQPAEGCVASRVTLRNCSAVNPTRPSVKQPAAAD
jgi:hypothetical protein